MSRASARPPWMAKTRPPLRWERLRRWRSRRRTTTRPVSRFGSSARARSRSQAQTVRERREHAAQSERDRSRSPAVLPRAAGARRHVRLLSRSRRRRRCGLRGAVLAQGRLLDRVRARDDRARCVGGRVRSDPRRPTTARSEVTLDVPSGRVRAAVSVRRRRCCELRVP